MIQLKKLTLLVLLGMVIGRVDARPDVSGVFFGKARSGNRVPWGASYSTYEDFSYKARFFATSDYGYTPGKEYKLTGNNYGIQNHMIAKALYTRGQNKVAGKLFSSKAAGSWVPWLSDGGRCVFGLTFDGPIETTFAKNVKGPGQFDQFPGKVPMFNQLFINWGNLSRKKGPGASVYVTLKGISSKSTSITANPYSPMARPPSILHQPA